MMVSIIIPFYNRFDWLIEAINSVINQSYSDFELILIDDGSTEDFLPIMEEFKNDYRIHYFRQEHLGRSNAKNFGIRSANGKFIAFLDSDDLFLSYKLEIQVNVMENNPSCLLSHTSYNQINPCGEYIQTIHSGKLSGVVYPEILLSCPIATPTVMLRKSLLPDRIRFIEEISISEDIIFWAKCAKVSPILGIDIPLSQVRIHGNNAAFSTAAQITGLCNVINFGIFGENQLLQKKKFLSKAYKRLGGLYWIEGDLLYTSISFVKSFVLWPANPDLALGTIRRVLHTKKRLIIDTFQRVRFIRINLLLSKMFWSNVIWPIRVRLRKTWLGYLWHLIKSGKIFTMETWRGIIWPIRVRLRKTWLGYLWHLIKSGKIFSIDFWRKKIG